MKSTRLLLVLALLSLSTNSAVAHEDKADTHVKRTFALTYSPISALFGAHTLKLEYNTNGWMVLSAQLGVYNSTWSIKPAFNNQPGTFGELWAGVKFFVTGCALSHGLYLENSFFVVYGRTPDGTQITTPYTAGPDMWFLGDNFNIGYQYVTDFGLVLDFYAGLMGYLGWGFPNSSPGLVDAASYNLNIWQPFVSGRVGYAW